MKSAEMERQKKDFIQGAINNGISKDQANYIFQLVEKFAQYGFNKSHAAAYALIAYQTAYLKTHYPIYFFCASMNTELSNTDKLNLFYEELKRLKIDIRPPNINYSLSAIKAVGYEAISKLVVEREKNGKFKSISNPLSRVNSKNLNKLQLESLIKSGSFDEIDKNRKKLFNSVPDFIKQSKSEDEILSGEQDLLFDQNSSQYNEKNSKIIYDDWDKSEKIKKEFESIGFFVGEHPLKSNLETLKQYNVTNYIDFKNNSKLKDTMIAGTLISIQEKKTARGNPYAIIKLVDLYSMYEMFIFSEKLVENRNKLIVGNSFLIKDKKETKKEGVEKINLDNIFFIEDLTKKIIDKLVLQIDNLETLNLINSKKDTNGKSKLKIIFNDPKEKGQYSFSLNSSFNIKPEDIELFKTNNIKTFY